MESLHRRLSITHIALEDFSPKNFKFCGEKSKSATWVIESLRRRLSITHGRHRHRHRHRDTYIDTRTEIHDTQRHT